MRRLAIGILAHVDAGKTSLTEAMLYQSGQLRRLGRVDHGDAFLDTNGLERERGITIFSKQARLPTGDVEFQVLDTPGHVDFSAEMERALQVLDCAILVISGTDGVQAHTRTLWRLLSRYQVPTFLFGNKMDLDGADRDAVMEQLRALDEGCVDFSLQGEALFEEAAALGDEALLEHYLAEGALSDKDLSGLIAQRKLFPCFFGSALNLNGVREFMEGLARYAPHPTWGKTFGAQIYKVSRDAQGARLTWMKVTGGSLKVKSMLTNRQEGIPEGKIWEEKVDQIRLYSGEKFELADAAPAGTLCAVTGLSRSGSGQALGAQTALPGPLLEPVLTCQVLLPPDQDPYTVLPRLRELEEEDPQLHVVWQEAARQIHIQVMGEVQLEVLARLARERFGLEIEFGPGDVLYRETIASPVEGIGHFEPLRHYAEVHLLMEPGERGSGVRVFTACPTDALDLNWQRLILTHLLEREHRGVLTGAPITDIKVTLVAGRAHVKHTEGGDFRQATYRAVRQGLRSAESILLEPWYEVRLEVPEAQLGRAMSDLQRMGGNFEPPQLQGELAVLVGQAPVAGLRDYPRELAVYTRGLGRIQMTPAGFQPCQNPETVIADIDYDPDRDVDNPADSVFCSHGAGVTIKWDQVPALAHVDSGLRLGPQSVDRPEPDMVRPASHGTGLAQDKELMAIFEQTYGKVERQDFQRQSDHRPARTELSEKYEQYQIRSRQAGPEYLLVDGYNIIFAWEELKTIARENLDAARATLAEILANYRGFRGGEIILVFDAYKVKGNPGCVERVNGIYLVYTKEAETADAYIERTTYDLSKKTDRVRVATSDGPEQMIILGHGALRLPAQHLKQEIEMAQGQISTILMEHNRHSTANPLRLALEQTKNRTKEGRPGLDRTDEKPDRRKKR